MSIPQFLPANPEKFYPKLHDEGLIAYVKGDEVKFCDIMNYLIGREYLLAFYSAGIYLIETDRVEEGAPFIEKAAKGGIAEAQYAHGINLIRGIGKEAPQAQEGIEFLQLAARQGIEKAQIELEQMNSSNSPKSTSALIRRYTILKARTEAK